MMSLRAVIGIYLFVGVGLSIWSALRARSAGLASLSARCLSPLSLVFFWPLLGPITLWPEPKHSESVGSSHEQRIRAALDEAATVVSGSPYASLLPKAQVAQLLAEVARIAKRHTELRALLARPDFDLAQAEARFTALSETRASPRVLATARIHLDNVRRLHALSRADQEALNELSELSGALRTQLLLVCHAGASAENVQTLCSELWARVQSLGDLVGPHDSLASASLTTERAATHPGGG